MATIGLKIADSNLGGQLSLADTLAKGVFGDPEAEMKAKLYAAQIGNYGANTDFTRAKTKAEIDSENAILAAGPAIGAAAAAAIPDPVPVKTPRPTDSTGYGPQLAPVEVGVVNPAEQARIDALRAQERVLGPILARGNPDQVAKGVNTNYGGAVLSGSLGNPAAVDPNTLRVAGALYTGNAPTTSTVWSPGDTAGTRAAAEGDILKERDKANQPIIKEEAGGFVSIDPRTGVATPIRGAEPRPLGGGDKGLRDQYYADLKARQGQGQQLTATEQATLAAIEQERLKDTTVAVDPDKPLMRAGPGGGVEAVPGQPGAKPTPPYQGKTAKDDALNRIVALQQKLANKQPITAQEAALYESDYNLAYGPTITKTTDPVTGQQVPGPTMEPSIPANVPPINSVRVAAGLPPNAEPTAAPPPNLKPTSPEQSKERTYATLGAAANKTLDTLTPDNLPSNFIAMLSRSGGQPGIVNALLDNLTPGPGRQYAQAVSQFIEAYARPATGATISAADYASFYQGMIPLPNDTPEQLAGKAALRHNFVKNWAHTGFGNDPAAEAQFLRDNGLADAAPAGSGAAPPAGSGAAPPAGSGARGPDPNPPPPPGMRPEVWAKMPLSVRQHWND